VSEQEHFVLVLNDKENNMPKMKTNRGAAKRFKATGTGKIRRSKAFTSHILTKKSTKRKRNLRQSGLVDASNAKAVKRMLPYL
jgi:large subunit ribosomal protein L35